MGTNKEWVWSTHDHKCPARDHVKPTVFELISISKSRRALLRVGSGFRAPLFPQLAVPDVTEASSGADFLIFVIPHQFIGKICDQMKPHVKPGATGISLIKGIDEGPDGLTLISDIIRSKLEIEVSVLMGANIASEVAEEKFCETTIGATNESNGKVFKELLQTPNFRITVVKESDTVELCGALKVPETHNHLEVIFKASSHLFRLLMLWKLRCYLPVVSVFHQSIAELEAEMLNGQKLQGPQTSAEVYKILQKKNMVHKFPLFVSVYQICFEGRQVQDFISCLQNHPEHM
ncbi:glycerol-3-phosphate dehydrogenase 1-like protein [Sinocyclocheilus grahami]|uniref:glycerol-3-phosphate dehydrogenase 1-like protein n=1 Tax=Sinocyclocheilus grahami TaxID=75366 RepID=UPI0007AC7381|nr:PREDICTED: glycerol-3-phosphate dehydrogenase 1-like protein [Sinocyclocheilus grahami]